MNEAGSRPPNVVNCDAGAGESSPWRSIG